MKRVWFNRRRIARALRRTRRTAGLTQRQVAERSLEFEHLEMGRLLESQISDFERGRALPSLGNFLNFLAACSPEGDQVDLRAFLDSLAASAGENSRPDELKRMAELARQREADSREVLLEGVFYKVLVGPEAGFDSQRDQRIAGRRLVVLARLLRTVIARQRLTPADLDRRLSWPEGRTERRLAEPSELTQQEFDLLCQSLGSSMDKMV